MRRALLSRLIAVAGMASPALGADVQPYAPEPALTAGPSTSLNWSGCYIGAQGGGGWGRREFVNVTGTEKVAVDAAGFLAGGQLGCSYELPFHLVLGIEGDGIAAGIKGSVHRVLTVGSASSDQNFQVSTDWLAAQTGRIGYAWDRWMLYAKGGAAWSHYAAQIHIVNCIVFSGSSGCTTGEDSKGDKVRAGWTVGTGLEWAFWNRWFVRLEYGYYDFGERVKPSGGTTQVDLQRNVHAVTLGMNYRFWSFPNAAPLIAKD